MNYLQQRKEELKVQQQPKGYAPSIAFFIVLYPYGAAVLPWPYVMTRDQTNRPAYDERVNIKGINPQYGITRIQCIRQVVLPCQSIEIAMLFPNEFHKRTMVYCAWVCFWLVTMGNRGYAMAKFLVEHGALAMELLAQYDLAWERTRVQTYQVFGNLRMEFIHKLHNMKVLAARALETKHQTHWYTHAYRCGPLFWRLLAFSMGYYGSSYR